MYIHEGVSSNEFIMMLKQRFLQDENVDLEDIWIYRVLQLNNQNTTYKQSLVKITYDIHQNYDIPMFITRIPLHVNSDTFPTRWNKTMDKVYIYVVINPAKINPRTGTTYKLLRKLDNHELQLQEDHYNVLNNELRKADLQNKEHISFMYN